MKYDFVEYIPLYCLRVIVLFTYEQKNFEDLSMFVLTSSVKYLIDKDLILRAGIEVPVYVHYQYADLWLVKIPSENWSSAANYDTIMQDENVLHVV